MKLSKITKLALKGTDAGFKKELAKKLGVSVQTLYRYIDDMDPTLTQAAALQMIKAETGLNDEQLFETEPDEASKSMTA